MLDMAPVSIPASQRLPDVYPAEGKRRARVALLAGCVQQVLAPEINLATLRVLSRNGIEVIIPRQQGCCGALAMHAGKEDRALGLARANLRVFPTDIDGVITNAAGCGSGIKEYPVLFKGTAEEDAAADLAAITYDISEFLVDVGWEAPPPLPQPLRAAYHDACHLIHAQGVREAPRQLLTSIPNLELIEIPEGDMCCGSAGTYNLEQPELAGKLGDRKAHNILNSGAQAVVMGNIGCLIQIQLHLRNMGRTMPLLHTVQLLDFAYRSINPS